MGLSRLAEKCRICPKVDTCQNKRMEAMGFLDGPCERELAAFQDAVEKAVAIAAQIPQHILCKHYMGK